MARVRAQTDLQESFSFVNQPAGEAPTPPFDPRALFRLSSSGVFIGSSSWKYRGWEGTIYRGGYASEAQFQRVSLREYTSYFPVVGIDFTYYAWPLPEMMSYLLDSTPENFRLCPKVTKRITLSSFPNLPAYGKWAGQKNPDFLNLDLFTDQFLNPIRRIKDRVGVILFEFSGPDENELGLFRSFFENVPREFTYAIEFRNPSLVTPSFYQLMRDLNLSPVFSSWTKMPEISEQWRIYLESASAGDSSPLVGLGLLRPGRSYEEAVQIFQPYKEIKDIYFEGRKDLSLIAKYAVQQGRKAYILVTNRFEGSAPCSVGAILDLI